jgi:hypothetical protein
MNDITDFKYKMYDMISMEIKTNKGKEINYPIYSVRIKNDSFEWLPLILE